MELIKDVIKVDNRIDFGKFQTFIEAEAVVPDKKLDVYEIVKTEGYISLKKIEMADGKILCRGSFNYNVIYIADDKNTISNVDGKVDINEVIEKDNVIQDMEYMLFSEVEHMDCTIMNERKIKVGALMNIRGSLFEKQRLDIVKDVAHTKAQKGNLFSRYSWNRKSRKFYKRYYNNKHRGNSIYNKFKSMC